jgi:6-phosphogluconate dehydrogenase
MFSKVFHRWNKDDWDWRLLQNTADILKFKNENGC